jgi:hypothetical protein
MTASTLAEMVAAARETVADCLIGAFGESGTWTPADGSPRTVYAKVRPSRETRFAGRSTDQEDAIDVYLRRDEAHATEPGVEALTLKSTLELSGGRVFTFHGRVLHENPVRRVIVMTRQLPVNFGKR